MIESKILSDDIGKLWAKSNGSGDRKSTDGTYRPLRLHLIDTACVCEQMWDYSIPPGRRAYFANIADVTEKNLRTFAILAAAFHDIGKAEPHFQRKYKAAEEAGVANIFGPEKQTIGRKAWHPNRSAEFALDAGWSPAFADILRWHHGKIRQQEILTEEALRSTEKRGAEPGWVQARRILGEEIINIWGETPRIDTLPTEVGLWLSGLIITCDWIASFEEYYPAAYSYNTTKPVPNAQTYLPIARKKAGIVLQNLGWLQQPGIPEEVTFTQSFFPKNPEIMPNKGQKAIFDAIKFPDVPSITLIEYPMGYGKSEAALEIVRRIARAQNATGMFFALPTRASSDPMFERVTQWLKAIHPHSHPSLQLLHGTAAISKSLEKFSLSDVNGHRYFKEIEGGEGVLDVDGCGDKECGDGPIVAEWFSRARRGMLSTYAVGTVDQLLIAGLTARYGMLRFFGLGNKPVVVVDEVHAYDRYMSDILMKVLGWLEKMGVSVILLSATLTEDLGRQLIESYLGKEIEETWAAYPRFIHARNDGKIIVEHVDLEEPKHINIVIKDGITTKSGRQSLLAEISKRKSEGGRYAIIVNTVENAQNLRREAINFFHDDEVILYHARMREIDRQKNHQKIEEKCNKNSKNRTDDFLLVIATQVLEQSIDVDFDALWSEIAPLDAMLQRIGRSHRHKRNPEERPRSAQFPTLFICDDGRDDGFLPYSDYWILRTRETLKNIDHFIIPDDIDRLMEATYTDKIENDEHLREKKQEAIMKNDEMGGSAAVRTIRSASGDFLDFTEVYDRGELVNDHNNTDTRWNADGIRVVVLFPEDYQETYTVDNLILKSLVVSSKKLIQRIKDSGEKIDSLKIVGPKACLLGSYVIKLTPDHTSVTGDKNFEEQRFIYESRLGLVAIG